MVDQIADLDLEKVEALLKVLLSFTKFSKKFELKKKFLLFF